MDKSPLGHLTYELSRQQIDVRRIDDLAILCRGKVAVAAILAARLAGVSTVEDAARIVNGSPDQVTRLLASSGLLYYGWIAEAMDDTRANLSKIDFSLVSSVRGANLSTRPIFEQVLTAIEEKIDQRYGVLHSVDEISRSELAGREPRESIIKFVSEIKKAALEMKGLCWRLLHPWVYIVTDIRLIGGLLALGAVAIPAWYFFGDHHLALSSNSPPVMVNTDLAELLRILNQKNQSFWSRALESIRYISQTALILPTLLAVLATLLTVARQVFPTGGSNHARLKGFEARIYDLGKTLQERFPQPPKGPAFIDIKGSIMGDQFFSFGNKAAVGPNATFNDYGDAWKQAGQGLDLKLLAGELEQLRISLKDKTQNTVEEDEAIAAVGGAAKAAKEGNGPTALERLAKAGEWALKVAQDIGVKVAAEMITTSMKVK